MTHQEVLKTLDEMKLPYAYHHFVEGESPDPPFLVLLYPNSDNFAADGMVYFKVNRLNIELYTELVLVKLFCNTLFDKYLTVTSLHRC